MKFSWSPSSMRAPKLVVTAEDSDFDPVTLQNWKTEGFDVSYLAFDKSRKEYVRALQHLADPLDLGECYAIVGLSIIQTFHAIALTALQRMERLRL